MIGRWLEGCTGQICDKANTAKCPLWHPGGECMGILYTILPTFTVLMEKVIGRIQLTEEKKNYSQVKGKYIQYISLGPRRCEKKGLMKAFG